MQRYQPGEALKLKARVQRVTKASLQASLDRMSTRRSPSAHSITQRARRANAALPLRLRITASKSPRSSAVNVILSIPIQDGVNTADFNDSVD